MMPISRANLIRNSRIFAFLVTTFIALQACSGSEFGRQLSESFDTPIDSNFSSAGVDKSEKNKEKSLPNSVVKSAKNTPIETSQMRITTRQNPKLVRPLISLPPQPYRITIKLSKADPSAPAEAVTKALRMAGVSFEVEKIERVEVDQLIKARPFKNGVQP